jgi:hypothetical protein
MRPEDDLAPAALESTDVVRSVVDRGGSLDDVLAHLPSLERVRRAHSDEDLALALESGAAVLVAVDVGVLENDPSRFGYGEFNGVVWVWTLQRDEHTGAIASVSTSGEARSASVSIAADQFFSAWLGVGGWFAEIAGASPSL